MTPYDLGYDKGQHFAAAGPDLVGMWLQEAGIPRSPETRNEFANGFCEGGKVAVERHNSRRCRNNAVARHIDGDGTIRDVHLS